MVLKIKLKKYQQPRVKQLFWWNLLIINSLTILHCFLPSNTLFVENLNCLENYLTFWASSFVERGIQRTIELFLILNIFFSIFLNFFCYYSLRSSGKSSDTLKLINLPQWVRGSSLYKKDILVRLKLILSRLDIKNSQISLSLRKSMLNSLSF